MVENQALRSLFNQYMERRAISGVSLIARRGGSVICEMSGGFADIQQRIPMNTHTVLRLASMTKPIVAIAAMMLEEQGRLSIDSPVSNWLPAFEQLKAAEKTVNFAEFYEADPDNPAMPRMNLSAISNIPITDARRPVTLRDLLSHSGGMGQGPLSMQAYDAGKSSAPTLAERVNMIATLPLDFQPGTATGYSANVAFDVLGRIVELASGTDLNTYITEKISRPLGCGHLSFLVPEAGKEPLARLYEGNPEGLRDVSDTEAFWQSVSSQYNGYYSGSAGMVGSVADYDLVVQMLAHGGEWNGIRLLKKETVEKMHSEGATVHLEMCPGMVWGLGMVISQDPVKMQRAVGKNTYGWSGAYGTHFYIDPENDLTVTLGVNCSNIGGADSPFSKDVEKIMMEEFCKVV